MEPGEVVDRLHVSAPLDRPVPGRDPPSFVQFIPDFQGERFKALAQAVQSLKPLAEKYDLTIYQFVLTATLMHPGIDVAVVGIKNKSHIDEAIGATGKTISREDYFAVRKALAIDGISKIKDAGGERK